MKILLVNHHCRRLTTRFRAGSFSRELAKRGHDVTLVCTSDTSTFRITEIDSDGVHYVEMPDLLCGKLRTGWDPWNLLRRSMYLKSRTFDIVHAFETRPVTIHPVFAMLRHNPAPLVIDWIDWWGRGGLIKEHRPLWYQWLFGWFETYYEEHFRTLADATTVISKALGERAVTLGVPEQSITWIPNGAPVDTVAAEPDMLRYRNEFGIPNNAFVVADSALDVTMGIDLAFRAVAVAAARLPHLLMIMTGGRKNELEKRAATAGISSKFKHLGELPFDHMIRALSCADLFLMPYPDRIANRGRWPGRIGTYMAIGRPLVSNSVGEVKHLVENNRFGLLVPEDPQSMASAVLELASNSDMRQDLGLIARRTAETHTWARMTDRLESCYLYAVRCRTDRQASERI